ncbi:MAG TPA: SpoIIE family protein phosphatase, partial [Thermoflexia bacterium]|nr:SpoIIE family protein phosphatase [Thermoflexia bacterium]
MITCLKCGAQNRRGAKFCSSCGADLSPLSATPSNKSKKVKRQAKDAKLPAKTRPLPSTAPTQPLSQTIGRLPPLQPGSTLTHPQNSHRRYSIVAAHELARSTYYDALDLTCPSCGSPQPHTPADGLCQQCRTTLQPVLIHERRARPNKHLSETDIEQLIRLSAGHPNILPHRAIVQYQESVYTVVEHPGRWGVLVRGQRQRSPDEALAGAAQVGQALAYLHGRDFAHLEVGGASIESLIITGGERSIRLADLSTCARLQPGAGDVLRAQINSNVAFLASLLFYLATGEELQRAGIELVPAPLRIFIERAMQGQYASVQDMLTDFALMPSAPPPARPLKPSHGQATHPGQKHPRNEDAVVTFTFDKEQDGRAVPVGFYLVADGMGGHDAGDVASRTVNKIVTDWIIKTKVLPDLQKTTRKLTTEDVPGELLAQAIQQANGALVSRAQAEGSDLGSTVTAALIIGSVATIASTGDSRTYLLREGRLEQITQDHSLVARLVDAGVIGPEDVRSHPQRNQIYRCLGHDADVEVDTFTRQLRAGDVLLLCSDGLWEMVLDDEIQRIIE